MKITQKWKLIVIVLTLAATMAVTEKRAERWGDTLQIALPALAFACAITNGSALEYAGRFLVLEAIVQGSKYGLGDAPINIRPNGGDKGFPSGHTAAAVFGASSLVGSCIEKNPWVKGAVIITAGFVGGSRIDANKHNVWQVLAGALVGWLTDRLFRRARTPLIWIKARYRAIRHRTIRTDQNQ
jgi:membrane-associated phospholipid phosphatase